MVIARDGYTFLDLLSDVGGLQGMLISGMAYVLAFWNYNHFDNFMVSRLYKIYKPNLEHKFRKKSKAFKQSKFMKPRFLFNPKEYCRDLVPTTCLNCRLCKKCCEPNRLDGAFQKARIKMLQEINIIEIIKSRRLQGAALKILLTKQQRRKLKEQSRYLAIDPDDSSSTPKSKKKKPKRTDADIEDQFTDGFYSSSSSHKSQSNPDMEFEFDKNDEDQVS